MYMVSNSWGPYMGCTGTTTSPGSLFEVASANIPMTLIPANGPPNAANLTLVVNPGIPPEELHLNCFGGSDQDTTLWWQKWCSWHYEEMSPPNLDTASLCYNNESDDQPADGWTFAISDGWKVLRDEGFLVKTYRRTHQDLGFLEIGWEFSNLSLTHEPIR